MGRLRQKPETSAKVIHNDNSPTTKAYWTSDFMAYIEALMIGKLMENSAFLVSTSPFQKMCDKWFGY